MAFIRLPNRREIRNAVNSCEYACVICRHTYQSFKSRHESNDIMYRKQGEGKKKEKRKKKGKYEGRYSLEDGWHQFLPAGRPHHL